MMESKTDTPLPTHVLTLLPLKSVVMLPKSIIPIIVGRRPSIRAVEQALKEDKRIFITAQKDAHVEKPTIDDVFGFGAIATIIQVMRMPGGALKILAEGLCRAQIIRAKSEDGMITVECEELHTTNNSSTIEIEALWRQLSELYTAYSRLDDKAPTDFISTAGDKQDIDYLTDTMSAHITLSLNDRQQLLATTSLSERILLLCGYLQREIEILRTEQKIRGQVQTQVDKNQREYYLSEQMKAIQKELGRDDQGNELEEIRASAKNLGLSAEATIKVEKELKRLEQMPPLSAEAVVSRHYVDWITSLPWKKTSKDTVSLTQAEKLLNAHHFGLKKAKDRIIEFLAAKKYSKTMERSPIICLVGPPGVGKTSLAQSIAESMGREFVRISLGGVRDEAEIRGHRRTYIGALPGKIIQCMKRVNVVNPVILLDEIDKMSQDIHGDPASALLEVLDPEQNNKFVDHFLDLEYNLSKVMFIATANMIENIPYPLFDRMEIVNLDGYTCDEKIEIARKFLIPKNLKEYNLRPTQFTLGIEQIKLIIENYSRESGVRQLERVIAKLMRKAIQQLLKKPAFETITITNALIKEWLGSPTFKKTNLNQSDGKIGIATGLAWTEVGGDVLEIETTSVAGKGGLTLTGQLGEVMQESAQAALSYIRSRAPELGLKGSFYTSHDLHIHIPEGATPKDGPSAGIAMCCALISALTKKPVKKHCAMTGEITLQGRVLGIGGLKEKLLAARQYDIKTVIIPHENYDDAQEILKDTDLGSLQIIYVNTMDEVLNATFGSGAFEKLVEKKQQPTKRKSSKKK
jgi:ATP-dependent Lon protease